MSILGPEFSMPLVQPLSEKQHDEKLMTTTEAARSGLVPVFIDPEIRTYNESLGATYDDAYLESLSDIQWSFEPIVDYLMKTKEIEQVGYEHGLEAAEFMRRSLDDQIEAERQMYDRKIVEAGEIYVVSSSSFANGKDQTRSSHHFETKGKRNRPPYVDDPWENPGHRVARLMGCVAFSPHTLHYEFEVQDKSKEGHRYILTPSEPYDLFYILYPKERAFIKKPTDT